jgi:hypothetical protein
VNRTATAAQQLRTPEERARSLDAALETSMYSEPGGINLWRASQLASPHGRTVASGHAMLDAELPGAGCGTALLDALDRATGAAPEAHEWLTMPPAFDARVELPDRIEHVEAALFAARRLTLQMTGWLSARQLAIVRFVVSLEHERGRAAIPPTDIEVALGEPTWHEEHLVRLLKERLARVELAAPVIALRLEAKEVREAEAPSDSLFPEPGGTPQDHARLMELLSAPLRLPTSDQKSRRSGAPPAAARKSVVPPSRAIYPGQRGCLRNPFN